jgi:hypothetical protein
MEWFVFLHRCESEIALKKRGVAGDNDGVREKIVKRWRGEDGGIDRVGAAQEKEDDSAQKSS